ncbi:hypothetical protein SEA_SCHWARTZ33_5 [Gordonia phage Schwartz33]|nr:hypothetical protein SEA_SCHWARTZ33_5 [Gordonia phage Schwartz33]
MSNALLGFLEHYGVKGMRWGVRKERKEIIKSYRAAQEEFNRRYAEQGAFTSVSEKKYSQLSDEDFVVGKDAVLRRTTKDLAGDAERKITYLSTNEADALIYRGIFPAENMGLGNSYKGYYESTYEATTLLKSPSEKKRIDGYMELMDSPEIKMKNGETITGREYLKRCGLGDTVDQLSSKELTLTYYGQFMRTQGQPDEPLTTAYFDKMAKQGYTALIDDHNQGFFSKTPIIVLEPYKNIKLKEVKQLTTQDVHDAITTLQPPEQKRR